MLKSFPRLEAFYDESTNILSGPAWKPYYHRNCSFGRIAFEELRRRPNHICQISDSENTRLTCEEVRLQGIRLSRFFESLGLSQDDIIGFCARNTTYAMSVPVACFFSGITCHAISPYHDKGTARKLFNMTKPKVIFCDGQDLEKISFASSDFKTKIYTISNHVNNVPSILELLKPTGDEHEFEPAELKYGPDQNLYLACTSGSTGVPKAATIPNSVYQYMSWRLATVEDVQFINSTLDWTSALESVMGCLLFGPTRLITDKPITAEYFLEIIQKYKVTLAFQTPPLTNLLLKSKNTTPEKLDGLRYYLIGGSASTVNLIKELQTYLRNGEVVQGYGSTELNTSLTRNFYSENKLDSVGRVKEGYKLRIVNDKGENLGIGEVGELCCKRPGFWAGYFNDPEATRAIFDEDGWFYTGDLGYIDEDYYVYLVGRKKELLKYRAMHYYPKDIEDVISKMPGVKEVCVFGIEDKLFGEKAGAAIVKVDGSNLKEADVVEYVRQKIDAEHKHLNAGCKFFKEIPRSTNDKHDRVMAKKMFLSSGPYP